VLGLLRKLQRLRGALLIEIASRSIVRGSGNGQIATATRWFLGANGSRHWFVPIFEREQSNRAFWTEREFHVGAGYNALKNWNVQGGRNIAADRKLQTSQEKWGRNRSEKKNRGRTCWDLHICILKHNREHQNQTHVILQSPYQEMGTDKADWFKLTMQH
jgi:hypothetical protein